MFIAFALFGLFCGGRYIIGAFRLSSRSGEEFSFFPFLFYVGTCFGMTWSSVALIRVRFESPADYIGAAQWVSWVAVLAALVYWAPHFRDITTQIDSPTSQHTTYK